MARGWDMPSVAGKREWQMGRMVPKARQEGRWVGATMGDEETIGVS